MNLSPPQKIVQNSMEATNTVLSPTKSRSDDTNFDTLPPSNPAVDILQRSTAEKWIHFDVVEKDKLEWMRDIPLQSAKLKPGQKFEARFDWKGVLLPYTMTDVEKSDGIEKDDRELYLHGDEPHRPGKYKFDFTINVYTSISVISLFNRFCDTLILILIVTFILTTSYYNRSYLGN